MKISKKVGITSVILIALVMIGIIIVHQNRGPAVDHQEELVKKLNAPAPEAPRAEEVLRVDYVKEVTRRLESTLGRKVKLTEGPNNRGRITLEYYGADDRERLIAMLAALENT